MHLFKSATSWESARERECEKLCCILRCSGRRHHWHNPWMSCPWRREERQFSRCMLRCAGSRGTCTCSWAVEPMIGPFCSSFVPVYMNFTNTHTQRTYTSAHTYAYVSCVFQCTHFIGIYDTRSPPKSITLWNLCAKLKKCCTIVLYWRARRESDFLHLKEPSFKDPIAHVIRFIAATKKLLAVTRPTHGAACKLEFMTSIAICRQ